MTETAQALKHALQAGNLPAAAPLAKALLETTPSDAALRQTLAKIYAALGQSENAVAVLQEGLRLPSHTPNDMFNFAYALRGLGAFREAIDGYKTAIENGLTGAEDAHINIAALEYEEFGDVDAAVSALTNALATNPKSIKACLNLGNILEATNQFEAADKVYSTGLENYPQGYEILARLVKLRDFSNKYAPLLERIKAALESKAASAEDRALMGFAYGDALNAIGEYDEAFEVYSQANQAVPAFYDRAQTERFFAALKHSFPTSVFLPSKPPASPPKPIFICGMFRSGSTLLEQVLGAHTQITPLGELPFFERLAAQHGHLFTQEAHSRTPTLLAQVHQAYSAQPLVKSVNTPYFTDKRPDNFLYLGLIKQLFPKAKIIHTRRDARDTALSIFSTQLGAGQAYAQDLGDTAHYMSQYQALMQHWRDCFGDDIYEVDYEVLTHTPEDSLTPLFKWLELAWEPDCLSFYNAQTHVKTASYKQVRQPLHGSSVGRWRNYASVITPHFEG